MSRLPGRLQTATTTGTTQRLSVAIAPTPAGPEPVVPAPGSAPRHSRVERRVLMVGGALLGGVLAAIVLAGSLSDAMTSRAAMLDARLANEALHQRVEAGRREVDFAQTPAFLAFTARSFGWGSLREHAFALKPGGPPPPVIEPLGEEPAPPASTDVVQSVLELLFER